MLNLSLKNAKNEKGPSLFKFQKKKKIVSVWVNDRVRFDLIGFNPIQILDTYCYN